MYKETFYFEELKCHDCALEIVEKIEKYDFIKNVYIDMDSNSITIESERDITKEEVEKTVKSIFETNHEQKHTHYLNNMQNLITEEFVFENIDCPNCAAKVENALNKNDDIVDARVNFVTKKVIIKHLNNVEIYKIASKIVSTVEKGATLEKMHDHDHNCCHDEHDHHCCHDEHDHHCCHDEHDECCHDEHDECCHEECTLEKHNVTLSSEEKSHDIITSTFNFEDIDCANCAAKVERALNKNENIIDASVNFIEKTIIVKHKKNIDAFNVVSKVLKANEPDAYLVNEDGERKTNKTIDLIKKIVMIVGVVLFFVGLFLMHIADEEICNNLGFTPLIDESLYQLLLYLTFIPAYFMLSYDLIYKSIYGIIHGDVFNESLLMVVASLGALCLSFFGENEFVESCAVILLYKIGEYFQDKATDKSKNAIKDLIEMKKDTVTLKDGTVKSVKEVKVGEIITIKVGEQIPLDGIIAQGETNVDTKALTGESVPIFAGTGEEILSGSINLTKVIDVEVTKVDSESTMSKVLKLVEDATNQKSKSEQFITKFARIYTPAILAIALVIAIVESITGLGVPEGTNFVVGALTNVFSILVISCPCALVISIPLGYFAGIGRFSSNGILVRGGNFIEALTDTKTFVFDKTGTITKGNFKVNKIYPANGHSEEEVLALIAQAEQFSMHPIANSIQEAYKKEIQKLDNASVEEIGGAGLKVLIDGKTILVGNNVLMNSYNINYIENKEIGTILYLSVNQEFFGSIVIRDEIKEKSYDLFKYLNKKGYKTIMLTGDNEEVAKYVANELGISEVKAKILPQEKYNNLEKIISQTNNKVCYVGDGINDTPSLKRADIGIAMGGAGSDSAKECADVVIMNDDISKIADAIEISKYTRKIIVENIVFALGMKLIALIVSMIGILGNYAMVLALFADVGVCIIAILNVLRILKFKNKKGIN